MFNTYSSTITSKGQATIPVSIRKELGIKTGEKVIFEKSERGILLKSHSQLVNELYGSLKPKVKVKYSDKKANKAIEKFVAQEYLKHHGKTG